MTRNVIVATLIFIICVALVIIGMIMASKAKVSATRDGGVTAITASQVDSSFLSWMTSSGKGSIRD